MLPKEFAPYSTVQGGFYSWRDAGRWATINHHLVMTARKTEGREASPSAGAIDSRPVKSEECGDLRGGHRKRVAWITIATIRLIKRWLARA